MNGLTEFLIPLLAAADTTGPVRSIEYDLPATEWQWVAYLGAMVVALVLVVAVYIRDTVEVGWFWRFWLTALRLAVFVALGIILFNPQERTQKTAYRPSRVSIAFDTSLSMGFPEKSPEEGASGSVPAEEQIASRSEAIRAVFEKSPVIEELRKKHEVTIYTFDSQLSGKQHIYAYLEEKKNGEAGTTEPAENENQAAATERNATDIKKVATLNWEEMLRPRGLESRLGESVRKLIDEESGKTLAGLVVVSDGALNAGIDHLTANAAARQAKVRLVTVGTGGTRKQSNLKLAGLQAPTDVHVGDPYEITALIQGQGFADRAAEVELAVAPEDDEEATPVVVDKRQVTLLEDGVPVEVKFQQTPSVAAKLKYTIRVKPVVKVREADDTDNQETATISVVDKKTRVLLIAGGPMRDYQFVRNMLFRHKAVKHDVWLQSVLPETVGKVSQESETLLISFPDNEADLFQYDVILGFDVNWRMVPPDSLKMLNRWVAEESGGLILVAGDVFTPELGGAADTLAPVVDLYPVYLSGSEFQIESNADQAWPFNFSRDGEDAGFLQLTDDQQTSAAKWKEFEGVYKCYPTSGEKPGATVYARFPDPRSGIGGKQPVLMASQFFGSGRVVYIGTGEMWRLRQLSDEYYDRFWTKTIREVGQERLTRGTQRALLMPERDKYYIGQTVRVRGRVLDAKFQPLEAESVAIDIVGPDRRPLSPARRLERDKTRAGQFVGDFRATQAGKYRLELRVPESSETEVREIQVRVPDVESEQREQNANLLTELARDTGGKYLKLEEVEKELAGLLPNSGETFIVDERLKSLWDRDWVMYALVGILSIEWLTRKLLKLA